MCFHGDKYEEPVFGARSHPFWFVEFPPQRWLSGTQNPEMWIADVCNNAYLNILNSVSFKVKSSQNHHGYQWELGAFTYCSIFVCVWHRCRCCFIKAKAIKPQAALRDADRRSFSPPVLSVCPCIPGFACGNWSFLPTLWPLSPEWSPAPRRLLREHLSSHELPGCHHQSFLPQHGCLPLTCWRGLVIPRTLPRRNGITHL